MLSTTRFSPSSYPTLSFHVGNETEIACGVSGGTDVPNEALMPEVQVVLEDDKESY